MVGDHWCKTLLLFWLYLQMFLFYFPHLVRYSSWTRRARGPCFSFFRRMTSVPFCPFFLFTKHLCIYPVSPFFLFRNHASKFCPLLHRFSTSESIHALVPCFSILPLRKPSMRRLWVEVRQGDLHRNHYDNSRRHTHVSVVLFLIVTSQPLCSGNRDIMTYGLRVIRTLRQGQCPFLD